MKADVVFLWGLSPSKKLGQIQLLPNVSLITVNYSLETIVL